MTATNQEKRFSEIFEYLRKILKSFEKKLDYKTDEPGNYYLDTRHVMKNKKPLFFAAVQVKKNYVSFHLMPVYVYPELLKTLSPELRKRMQGKSCFKFKVVDTALFKELHALTKAGYSKYQSAGHV